MSLKQLTFSAVRWTTFSTVFRSALQILQVAILARLLVPEDFGLMAIVTAIIGVAAILSDMGISSALIQRQEVTQQQLSSLYWLNVVAGFVMMLILAAVSPLISKFYGDTRLTSLVIITSSVFFIGAISQQLKITSSKSLHFAKQSYIEVISASVGFLSSTGLAYSGYGVFSLAWANVISALLNTLLVWLMLSNGWRPQFRLQIKEIMDFLKFGAFMVGNNLVTNLSMAADIFLGGRLLGPAALGLYSLPRNLCMQIQSSVNPIITRVGFPLMSRVQNEPDQLKMIYLNILRMTASVNIPIYIGLAVFAPEVVVLLFGEKWLISTDVLRILAVWGLLRSTKNPVGILLIATGRAKRSFKWNLFFLFIHPGVIWLGSKWGTEGLALALLLSATVNLLPSWHYLVKPCCGAGIAENIKQLVVPLWISLVAAMGGYMAATAMDSLFSRLLLGLGISALAYLVLSYFFNRAWSDSMLQLLNRRAPLPSS